MATRYSCFVYPPRISAASASCWAPPCPARPARTFPPPQTITASAVAIHTCFPSFLINRPASLELDLFLARFRTISVALHFINLGGSLWFPTTNFFHFSPCPRCLAALTSASALPPEPRPSCPAPQFTL